MTTNDHTPNANSIFNMDFEFGILASFALCLCVYYFPRRFPDKYLSSGYEFLSMLWMRISTSLNNKFPTENTEKKNNEHGHKLNDCSI